MTPGGGGGGVDLARARRRTMEILETAQPGDVVSRRFDYFIAALILANVAAVVFETVGDNAARYRDALLAFEILSVAVFTIEYLLRLWAATTFPKYADPVWGRVRYALTPMLLVDLVAILPVYLGVFLALDLRFVRVLRLLRMVKLTRHSRALLVLGKVFRAKAAELGLALFVLFITLVFVSSAMYFAETSAQPDKFDSIPASMWWGIVTLATVGYGDVVPVTGLGRVLGGVFMILGIMVYALPVAILASGYTDIVKAEAAGGAPPCPHCGKRP